MEVPFQKNLWTFYTRPVEDYWELLNYYYKGVFRLLDSYFPPDEFAPFPLQSRKM